MNTESNEPTTKKEWNLPYAGKIMTIIKSFSLTEKTVFMFFVVLFVASGLTLLFQVNKMFLVEVPSYGGSLVEGVIGTPRFINPLLASSDADKDLTNLIYSGLLKTDADGDLVPDLAESYVISDDGLTYTFILKDDIYFHDGEKVTADDVIFTITKAQDPMLKSPREANWSGVQMEKVDEKTIVFNLRQPYSPFIQNTTLGILPKHIWSSATIDEFPFSQFNTKAIGSGPYKIESITYTDSGIPSEYYLESFKKYSLGRPYIDKIVIKSYQNERDVLESFKKGDIESLHSISPKMVREISLDKSQMVLSPLPRIFGVFFNQNSAPVLVNKEVRSALDTAVNKQEIVDTVLYGYGQVIDGPVPVKEVSSIATTTSTDHIEKAREILTKKGWTLNDSGIFEKKDSKGTTRLSFSISTGSANELKETAMLLQKQWRAMGADVEVKIFEIGDLNQDIIRPRKYDALLFGEIISRDFDLYPFWHSSERADPGLNIALYTNIQADKLLENIRKTSDPEQRQNYLNGVSDEIKNDVPAVFTYSPYFIYIVPKKINDVKMATLTNPSERFSDVSEWYIETNNVWEIFSKSKDENQN